MTPISPEMIANLDRIQDTSSLLQHEAVLQVASSFDKRPWLAHAFTALLETQRSARNEPGIGEFDVSDETLNTAGRVLGSIRMRFLPVPA